MLPISSTLLVLNKEILGKYFNNVQLPNIQFISLTLLVSHFEISGKEINEEQPLRI